MEEPASDSLSSALDAAPVAGASLSPPPLLNVVPHTAHPGCCLTPRFEGVIDTAAAAVLVVNHDGYFIYANRAAEILLGYDSALITQLHILDIVAADPQLVTIEFQHLILNLTWSGNILLRRHPGGEVKVSVNAFSTTPANGNGEYIAFLDRSCPGEPALERVAAPEAAAALTMRELAVLQLVAAGLTDEEIAAVLESDETDVEGDVAALRAKLRAESRTETVVVALTKRLIA